MDAAPSALFDRLITNLEEMAKIYGQLSEVVRAERDLLISTDLEQLRASNERKEILIQKARFADELRLRLAAEAARAVGADPAKPRLLEIAQRASAPHAARLLALHGTLQTLIADVAEQNRANEEHARSALRLLGGAMGEIKETIAGKKTYGGRGQYKIGPDVAGNFVRKEA